MNYPDKSLSLYRNAMELLAIEEIEQQLQNLPKNLAESINRNEAIAYALNRLPPLYATSLEGYFWQQKRARETLKDLISKAASWGIKAAQGKKEFRSYGDTTRLMARYANTN
ncbi:late competence development ComFB family protein [Aerosakkonemataceae cyanobacterium BLCC-F50]|uniref:Late competence development ComFB family protein n=1 Tax=Floridaenema flaviceps BLCC-F50 TaxID=3153642 RepID=A0ABV4XXX6_9CYAN